MIYIHVGKPKTGTTSIQAGLVDNRRKLEDQGLYYPRQGIKWYGHHNVYYEIAGWKLFDPKLGVMDDLIKEISDYKKKQPNGNVLISSEAFIALPPNQFSAFYNRFKDIDRTLIYTVLRRQDKFLKSFWAMEVRRMNTTKSLSLWSKEIVKSNKLQLNYNRMMLRIEEFVPKENIILKTFEELKNGKLFTNFLKPLGISSSQQLKQPGKFNTTPADIALELLRTTKKDHGKDIKAKHIAKLEAAVKGLSDKFQWPSYNKGETLFRLHIQELIRKKYNPTNKLLAKRYPDIADQMAFSDGIPFKELNTSMLEEGHRRAFETAISPFIHKKKASLDSQ